MSFQLEWPRLLSGQRHALGAPVSRSSDPERPPRPDARTPFERDYDRIVFSAPFRRLAKKTQVHPFAAMDQIHNRLTHSLEVASVGRSLGYGLGRFIAAHGALPAGRSVEDIACILQAACLAHDIGNPPFGHAGEFAIREWVKENTESLFGTDLPPERQGIARDWQSFEGNAQSFRMVARADNREQIYLRFTYASLGAMIKYPWGSDDPRARETGKYHYFASEASLFADLIDSLGLRRPDGCVVRHPLSYLTEAADDICYQIGDFEDAVQMRILPEAEVRDIFSRITGKVDERPLPALRARAISCLVQAAQSVMEQSYDAVMAGARPWSAPLKADFPPHLQEALRHVKERYPDIFNHRPKVAAELGAYPALGKILGTYAGVVRLLAEQQAYAELSFVGRRYMEIAWPEAYVRTHEKESYEWWLGRVMDFVAGMTDNYALQVAREISGG
ncbi:MAG: dGTP triphosphohydrolase [Chthoniobacterales bacterium]